MKIGKMDHTRCIYLGYLCKKICSQELQKIAQSGYIGPLSSVVISVVVVTELF